VTRVGGKGCTNKPRGRHGLIPAGSCEADKVVCVCAQGGGTGGGGVRTVDRPLREMWQHTLHTMGMGVGGKGQLTENDPAIKQKRGG
jgi:hypothetical protein